MAILLFANQAQTTLAAPISAIDTQIQVAYGTGSVFPQPSANQAVTLTLVSAVNSQITEIVSCTNITGDVLTVVRAQENTVARAWKTNDFITNLMTAGTANAFAQIYGLENGTYSGVFTSVSAPTATIGNAVLTTGQITTAPTNSNDIPNKAYVDAQIGSSYLAGTGLALAGNTFSIAPTGVTPGNVGGVAYATIIDVNAEGQITSALTESIQIDTTQVTGLGTIASQNSNAVAITGGTVTGVAVTGGSINGTPIGTTTPAQGEFTNLTAQSAALVSGSVTSAPVNNTDLVNKLYVDQQAGEAYTAGTGLNLSAFQFSIANTGANAGAYGDSSHSFVAVVNAQGQITSVTQTPIAIANTQVSGLGTMSIQNANNVNITGGTIAGITQTSTILTNPTITGGTIDNTIIGGTTPNAITASVYYNMVGGSF